MAVVATASRLHFGLISLPRSEGRSFGGAGLMVRDPSLRVRALPAANWSATGPLANRALEYARRLADDLLPRQAFAVEVSAAPPEHAGLGVGTQLALAVGHALVRAAGLTLDHLDLARRLGRGQRSAIGVHGFERGGFLVDGGKGPDTTLAPLLFRHDFPEEWQVLLLSPNEKGLHGAAEQKAFLHMSRETPNEGNGCDQADALSRLLLLGVMPCLVERDLAGFGAALHEFNRKVGETFAPWQGGVYASQRVSALVEHLTRQGISAGQSSWGPTVYAIAEPDRLERARHSLARIEGEQRLVSVLTRACNEPALVLEGGTP